MPQELSPTTALALSELFSLESERIMHEHHKEIDSNPTKGLDIYQSSYIGSYRFHAVTLRQHATGEDYNTARASFPFPSLDSTP